ncbi:hypothetical protein Tco_1008107 [Tanacetum coccineum]
MDSRQKRKRLSEANQQLLEKNVVNKPIDVGRNAATVNDKGENGGLKAEINGKGIDQHDHSNFNKVTNLDKVSPAAGRTISRKAHAKSRPEVPRIDGSGVSNVIKRPKDTANQIEVSVKETFSISGFDYECNDAYFDSALKFLHAASLLEAYYNDFSKLKGMVDPLTVYSTSAKLSKICAIWYSF